ncbi:hypothetical protein L9F63_016915, partial [Diploptera punctata]
VSERQEFIISNLETLSTTIGRRNSPKGQIKEDIKIKYTHTKREQKCWRCGINRAGENC